MLSRRIPFPPIPAAARRRRRFDKSRERRVSSSSRRGNRNEAAAVLFYRYLPLSDDISTLKILSDATVRLCSDLNLKGRVLLGLSKDAEGINGTLSGSEDDVLTYTVAMMGRNYSGDMSSRRRLRGEEDDGDGDGDEYGVEGRKGEECEEEEYEEEEDEGMRERRRRGAMERFWDESESFAERAGVPIPTMESPDDFKWSYLSPHDENEVSREDKNGENKKDDGEEKRGRGRGGGGLFPDLNVKMVREIIGTGGKLSSVKVVSTGRGYLTPREWHVEMMKLATTTTTETEGTRKGDANADGDEDSATPVGLDILSR